MHIQPRKSPKTRTGRATRPARPAARRRTSPATEPSGRAVLVLAGTSSGLFLFRSDTLRGHFEARGPALLGHRVADTCFSAESGQLHAAVGGRNAGVYLSRDLGKSWIRRGGEMGVADFTLLAAGHRSAPKTLYAAAAPALLYRSLDGGESWAPLHSFNEHATRREWIDQGCGVQVRALVQDPREPERLWVAVSGAGVFRSDDGGLSFQPRNAGLPGHASRLALYEDLGRCPHNLVMGARGALYLQGHDGLYRSSDHGETWSERTRALPTRFGHALAAHPREDEVWTVPESRDTLSTNGDLSLWRGRHAGRDWERQGKGLPGRSHIHIAAQALATDRLDPLGLYLGTSSGKLLASRDGGLSFRRLAEDLPEILSVRALPIDREARAI